EQLAAPVFRRLALVTKHVSSCPAIAVRAASLTYSPVGSPARGCRAAGGVGAILSSASATMMPSAALSLDSGSTRFRETATRLQARHTLTKTEAAHERPQDQRRG